jgi:hypothetical protein
MNEFVAGDVHDSLPRRHEDIVGNGRLKRSLWDHVRATRLEGSRRPARILAYGPSQSGKTATIQYAIKCMGCLNLDTSTLNACGNCFNCQMKNHIYGNRGWEDITLCLGSTAAITPIRYHFIPIDGARVSQPELDEVLDELRYDEGILRIIYIDEVHRLARRRMDEQLLIAMQSYNASWIASSARVDELDAMFLNRFYERIETERASIPELGLFLARKCAEWGIRSQAPQADLERLAERCQRIPGLALQVLQRARARHDGTLTRDMIEEHVF